jgi:hypothetical protein
MMTTVEFEPDFDTIDEFARLHADLLRDAQGRVVLSTQGSGLHGSVDKKWNQGSVGIGELQEAYKSEARAANAEGRNMYSRAAAFSGASPSGSEEDAVGACIPVLVADFDERGLLVDDIKELLSVPPTWILETSKGRHQAALKLDRCVTASEARHLLRKWRTDDGSGIDETLDPVHAWRVPGSVNWGHEKKRAEDGGAYPFVTKIVDGAIDGDPCQVEALLEWFGEPDEEDAAKTVEISTAASRDDLTHDQRFTLIRLENLLDAGGLDAPNDYPSWSSIAHGIKAEFGEAGCAFFHRWSATSDKYDPDQADTLWTKGIDPNGTKGVGELFAQSQHNIGTVASEGVVANGFNIWPSFSAADVAGIAVTCDTAEQRELAERLGFDPEKAKYLPRFGPHGSEHEALVRVDEQGGVLAEAIRWFDEHGQPFEMEYAAPAEHEGEAGNQEGHEVRFQATPYLWRDPASIPPREWLYGQHYIRGFLSATVSPGGIGKSALAIVEVLSMVCGVDLLNGKHPIEPLRVLYFNGEDPQEELDRRIQAACLHYGIDATDFEGRLFVVSGRDQQLVVAGQDERGEAVPHEPARELFGEVERCGIDVVVVDPFVSTHKTNENSNEAQEVVATIWRQLAYDARCAVEIVHHTRKTGGQEVAAEDARGASATVNATRSSRVLNVMNKSDADKAGIEHEERRRYFWAGSPKANMAPPSGRKAWRRLASVELGNETEKRKTDEIGVVETWKWPDPFENVTTGDLDAVQKRLSSDAADPKVEPWSESSRAKKRWVGILVADVLGLDLDDAAAKTRIKGMLKTWRKSGAIKIETIYDKRAGRKVKVVRCGRRIENE